MPGISFMMDGHPAHLDFTGVFKEGDPPPTGYMDWHAWAEVQSKAGLKQKQCGRCGKFKFPQELSGQLDTIKGRTGRGANRGGGREVVVQVPVCIRCLEAK